MLQDCPQLWRRMRYSILIIRLFYTGRIYICTHCMNGLVHKCTHRINTNTHIFSTFITAMDRCFNARHRSSNPVSARKTLTTAPPKFVQRLITARAKLAKQRWSSVQDFCVGLADPSVHELASSGAKLWLGVVGAVVNFAGAENCPLLTARNILCSSKLSER